MGNQTIFVIGAGGWGTALASRLAINSHEVFLWALEEEVADSINNLNENPEFLPGAKLPKGIVAVNEFSALKKADYVVLATPTQFIRPLLEDKKSLLQNKPVINVAKGIERNTLFRVSEILADVIDIRQENYAVLTGPSHAEEVIRNVPTTIVAASWDPSFSKIVQELFSDEKFRVYTSDDVIGCEIGGSLKNVIAIAAGIIDGLELGDNTKAALITRGLAEISRLGTALGAKHMTFSGLSGLGDLFVTCNSRHSRNRAVGERIGRGMKLDDIIASTKKIAEGIYTTESAYNLGRDHKVEMPIAEQMYEILFRNILPTDAIRNLMTRRSKGEWWW